MYRRELSYWLVPSTEYKARLREMMDVLMRKFNAPFFEPHLTLFTGDITTEEAINTVNALETMLRGRGRDEIRLRVIGVDHSDVIQKTLFIKFEISEELKELSRLCVTLSGQDVDFNFVPHVSLMYKKLEGQIRQDLASDYDHPFEAITYDQIAAVSTPTGIETKEDVEAWEVVIRREFGKY